MSAAELLTIGGLVGVTVGWLTKHFQSQGRNGNGNGNHAEQMLSRERHEAIMHGLERVVKALDGSIGVMQSLAQEIRAHATEARPAFDAAVATAATVKAMSPLVEELYHGIVKDLPRRRQGER